MSFRPVKTRRAVLDYHSQWLDVQSWFASSLGKHLVRHEHRMLNQVLSDLFGYFVLQVGSPCVENLLESSRIKSRIRLDYAGPAVCPLTQLRAEPVALPVQTDSVDVVVLPHVLEFSENPHQVLREVERVLIPEGQLVIMGFNPFSLWSLWRWRQQPPWNGHWLSSARVRDWLSLLGFEIIRSQSLFFRAPLNQHALMRRFRFMESVGRRFWPGGGAVWMIQARKKTETLTPIRPRWQARRKIVATGLAEP